MSNEISSSGSGEVSENTEANIESNETSEEDAERQDRIDDIESSLDDDGDEDVHKEISENSPYSDEINKHISSREELEVYKSANLHEETYGDPPEHALVRDDIDLHGVCDHKGRDNAERMQEGKCPITKDGNPIELHHIGQKDDSPLAELTMQEHRGAGNDSIMHDKTKPSEIERNDFSKERSDYWKDRGAALEYMEEGDEFDE